MIRKFDDHFLRWYLDFYQHAIFGHVIYFIEGGNIADENRVAFFANLDLLLFGTNVDGDGHLRETCREQGRNIEGFPGLQAQGGVHQIEPAYHIVGQ